MTAETFLEWVLIAAIVGSVANAALVGGFDPPEIPNWLRVWLWAALGSALARRYVGVQHDYGVSWLGDLIWLNLCLAIWTIVVWCWRHAEARRPLRTQGRVAARRAAEDAAVEARRLAAVAEVVNAAEGARRAVIRTAEETAARLVEMARREGELTDAASRTADATERTATATEAIAAGNGDPATHADAARNGGRLP